jgi:hypothetical protein
MGPRLDLRALKRRRQTVLPNELRITKSSRMNLLNTEPMMSLDKFIEETGATEGKDVSHC